MRKIYHNQSEKNYGTNVREEAPDIRGRDARSNRGPQAPFTSIVEGDERAREG